MVNFKLNDIQEGLENLRDFALDEVRPNAEHWDEKFSIPRMQYPRLMS